MKRLGYGQIAIAFSKFAFRDKSESTAMKLPCCAPFSGGGDENFSSRFAFLGSLENQCGSGVLVELLWIVERAL
ncbi:hypothetical protein LguiB_027905 [Lonicera macranthoides]